MPGFPRCGRLPAAASVSTDAFSGGLRSAAGGRLSGGRRDAPRMGIARAVRNDAAGSRRAEQLRGRGHATGFPDRREAEMPKPAGRRRLPRRRTFSAAGLSAVRRACPAVFLRDVRRESGIGRAKDRVSFWNLPSEFVLYALLQSRRASFERCDPLLRNRMPSVPAWLPPRFAGRPQLFACGTPLR